MSLWLVVIQPHVEEEMDEFPDIYSLNLAHWPAQRSLLLGCISNKGFTDSPCGNKFM